VSEERLQELYATAMRAGATNPPGQGAQHPAPEAIAALARREGDEAARLATLDHVMSCAECRREFDLLRAVERAGLESGATARGSARRSWFVPVALAASLLVAVGLGRGLLAPADDTTRGGEDAAVVLVQPGASAQAGDPVVFAWRAVPGASRYELELLDTAGAVAAAAATSDTSASPSTVRALPPGEYRWWVRAIMPDARSLRSGLRPLVLGTR
jgi:hypothetical protein